MMMMHALAAGSVAGIYRRCRRVAEEIVLPDIVCMCLCGFAYVRYVCECVCVCVCEHSFMLCVAAMCTWSLGIPRNHQNNALPDRREQINARHHDTVKGMRCRRRRQRSATRGKEEVKSHHTLAGWIM